MNHPPGDRITLSSLVASFHILFPFKRGWETHFQRTFGPDTKTFRDALLGPRCGRCHERVWPKDAEAHDKDCT